MQQTARKGLRTGVRGGDIFVWAQEALRRSSARDMMSFWAHGMGIIAPRSSLADEQCTTDLSGLPRRQTA